MNSPSIPNNYKYWQVFEDDLQIKIFLEMSDEFSNTITDGENQSLENVEDDEGFTLGDEEQTNMKGMIGGKDIIQLKINFIPKNPKVNPHEDGIQDQYI